MLSISFKVFVKARTWVCIWEYIFIPSLLGLFILLGKTSVFWVVFLKVIITIISNWLHVICFTTRSFIFSPMTFKCPPSQWSSCTLILSHGNKLVSSITFKSMDCFYIHIICTDRFIPFYQHFSNIWQTFHSCLFKLCRYPAIRHLSSCGILVTRTPPLLGTAVPGQVVPSNGFFSLADSLSKRKEYSERRIIG